MGKDLISVVVPAYNSVQWLSKCLDSLLAQTYTQLEILVIDSGSEDGTGAVAEAYAAKDSRVCLVHTEDCGVTAARLLGVQLARGNWIAFADADDMAAPQLYEHLLNNALANNAVISHCSYREDYSDGTAREVGNSGRVTCLDRRDGLRSLLEERSVTPALWNKLYHKTLFEGLEAMMDLSIRNNEDMLMNYYLFSKAEQSVFEDSALYYYWIREDSVSRGALNRNRIYDPIRVREIILENCEPWLEAEARRAYIRICLGIFYELAREDGEDHLEDLMAVQKMILRQLPHWRLLSARNAWAAWMIGRMPKLAARSIRLHSRLGR